MRNARRAACALWLAALLSCPAQATAASVAVNTHCDKYGCHEKLVYSAARGERNDVTVAQDGGIVSVRDAAGIQPGTACEALDAVSARCAFALQSFQRSAIVRLGDQADALDAREFQTGGVIRGGGGDDRLVGPDSAVARFVGGPGDDELTGGALPDIFQSNRRDGSDTMSGGAPPPLVDADIFPGQDEVFYDRSRPARLRAVLDGRPNDGARGERDNLLSIEGIWMGPGDDVVIGTAAAEFMYGGGGRDLLRGSGGADRLLGGDGRSRGDIAIGSADRLEGGAGPDVLDGLGGRDLLMGGSGRDTIDGGRGRDRIRSGDTDRDWVLCGRGFDRVAASAGDVIMRGCEEREGALGAAEGVVQWTFGLYVVSLIVACPVAAPDDCNGTLTLAAPGLPELAAPYSAAPGMATVVDLPFESKDEDEALGKLSGAVVSTASDSARFGELPDWPTDSLRDALGVPGL